MFLRYALLLVATICSLVPNAFAEQTFCGEIFDKVNQEIHDVMQVRRIDWVEKNEVANIRNFDVFKESIAALMRKPSSFEAMSFETTNDRAVVLFHQDSKAKSPEATIFVFADKKNQSTYAELVRDLMSLHFTIFSGEVRQLNFYIPVERGDMAKDISQAAKDLGLASTTVESDSERIKRDVIPGNSVPVDEFYDMVEIHNTEPVSTSGDFYIVTVYLN